MRRAVLIAVLVAVVGIAAYAVGTTRDDPMSIERVVIAGTTNDDATRDKWVTAECPDGMTAMSGGAVVPHGNDTPGVAIYWSAPYEDHGTSGCGRPRRTRATVTVRGCCRSRRSA